MRKILFILLISLMFSCSNKDNEEKAITLTIEREKSNLNPMGNAINVTLKNNSNKNTPVWVMSCSYAKNFTTDNKNIIFTAIECDKDIPKPFSLKPLEEKKFKLFVLTEYGMPKQKFRIGFFHINALSKDPSTIKKFQTEIKDSETEKIIWSNQLTL